jgi:hypothetical protein
MPVKSYHDGLVRDVRWNLHQLACSQEHLFAADLELQQFFLLKLIHEIISASRRWALLPESRPARAAFFADSSRRS